MSSFYSSFYSSFDSSCLLFSSRLIPGMEPQSVTLIAWELSAGHALTHLLGVCRSHDGQDGGALAEPWPTRSCGMRMYHVSLAILFTNSFGYPTNTVDQGLELEDRQQQITPISKDVSSGCICIYALIHRLSYSSY